MCIRQTTSSRQHPLNNGFRAVRLPKGSALYAVSIDRSAVCFKSLPRVGRFLDFRLPGDQLSAKPWGAPSFRKSGIVKLYNTPNDNTSPYHFEGMADFVSYLALYNPLTRLQ
jgi:hypothetical protein